ncbi:DUF4190 domain-containing protein [Nocardia sp. alder85J]|uniref:DUF4190 domain-containing protein n=1 Tax=Nocardia sp. alder85J TaxID=2862949 RepID=UPI001CD69E5F|nr:DUF4190 domain-containing protein [Nocardia sp. alder85J]MCX4093523.1 DUF4190 domain-containing protein [Nocardia sp. alder85J]
MWNQPPYYWGLPDEPIGSPVEHPHATTVLLLGALSVLCCGALGPVAWVMGKQALTQIDRSGGALGGRSQVLVGYILGMVGTGLMVAMAVLFVLILLGGHA